MRGRRVEFYPGFPREAQPGDYCRVPDSLAAHLLYPTGTFLAVDPTGASFSIQSPRHEITEHDDGTITVTPSIVGPGGWHGHLTAGVWMQTGVVVTCKGSPRA